MSNGEFVRWVLGTLAAAVVFGFALHEAETIRWTDKQGNSHSIHVDNLTPNDSTWWQETGRMPWTED